MKDKKWLEVTVKFFPGSDFQEEVGWEALKTVIAGWSAYYTASHKKNEIRVSYGEHSDTHNTIFFPKNYKVLPKKGDRNGRTNQITRGRRQRASISD